jgi:D-amino-acid dehydrogenase
VAHDVIVVGGGIVGSSVAYHLTVQRLRTLMIDADLVGLATDAGAGILASPSDTAVRDPVERFRALAAHHYPELIGELAEAGTSDPGYAVRGSLTVAVEAGERAYIEHARRVLHDDHQDALGLAVLDPEQARQLFPPLGESVLGAIYDRHRARVDGHMLALALREAATGRGLAIRHGRVARLTSAGDRLVSLEIDGETLAAGQVVLAAGCWSKDLADSIGLDLPVAPMRGQIVRLACPDADSSQWPIVSGFGEHYMVPWDGGRLAVGATREPDVGFAVHNTVGGVRQVLHEAIRVAPGLEHASVLEIRVGLRPASRDGLPILGPVPGVEGLILATGHGALGLQLGPFSGKVLADLIVTGDPGTGIDLGPFSLERFQR